MNFKGVKIEADKPGYRSRTNRTNRKIGDVVDRVIPEK